jgi:EPS-associated MarR family transcriptional regulator
LLVISAMHGRRSFACRAVALVRWVSVSPVVGDKIAQQRDDVYFRVLRLLESWPDASQREIAGELGVRLGAINFCVKALISKGYIKLANFKASKNKLGYVYVLTPEGVAHRARLASGFIERKIAEFELIQTELERLRGDRAEEPVSLAREWGGRE